MKEEINSLIDWNSLEGMSQDKIEDVARNILAEMSLEEKLKQMVGMYTRVQAIASVAKKSEGSRFYGLINKASGNKRLGIPPMIFSDGPRGVVGPKKGVKKPTCFPVAIARAASFDVNLEERVGNAIGTEMRVHGNDWFGGVCINQMYHPRGGRSQESYGEDTYILGEMGSALVRGVQKHKIIACSKHYAVNNQETTRMKVDVTVDERTLREVFLPHFKKCVDAGVGSLMAAYNYVNGVACGHHIHLLRDILKREWDFQGFVASDWIYCVRNGKEAILGGMDLEMPWEFRMKGKKMKRLVESGEIPENYIDEAVIRLLRTKIRFAHSKDDAKYPVSLSACKEHVQLALEAARKGIVLLENNNDFLPLKRSEVKRIGVFGEYADKPLIGDKGSSRVSPEYVITVFKGVQKLAGDDIEVIHYDGSDVGEAVSKASNLDVVVIVAGFDYKDEGEAIMKIGGDREFMTLKPRDIKLIENIAQVNQSVIVVMHSGGSIITESWREKVKAILMFWYGGMEGGTALGEIIFGDVNPSGKCPCTFPKSEKQLPAFNRNARKTTYGYYHGYRFVDKYEHIPRYPFGYGLSYTTFSYSNLKLDNKRIAIDGKLQISVDVKNTGKVDGDEVVQVYISAQNSKVERHIKELKRFKRIFLNSGESKTVSLSLSAKDLSYYDVSQTSWSVEPLTYKLYVGSSSDKSDLLEAQFTIP